MAFSATLSAQLRVLAFAGSTREDSANKKLVAVAANQARQSGAYVTIIDLKDFPIAFYDGDLESKEGMPAKAKELRKLMVHSDVILIASPEYNGSLSATLKNVLDWASRSEAGGSSRDAFAGKIFGLMSASPGQSGGARGLVHLRNIIENIGGTVISQQVVLPDAYNAFDAQGCLKIEKIKQEMKQLIQATLSPR